MNVCRLLTRACLKYRESLSRGRDAHDAWNSSSVYFVKAAEVDRCCIGFHRLLLHCLVDLCCMTPIQRSVCGVVCGVVCVVTSSSCIFSRCCCQNS